MRKWILLFILGVVVFGAIAAHADTKVDPIIWKSSFTATADTTKEIPCSTSLPNAGCRFHGVIVSSAGVNSTLTVYNSSATANNIIAIIDTNGSTMKNQDFIFDVFVSSGLTYTNAGSTPANIVILYAKPTIR